MYKGDKLWTVDRAKVILEYIIDNCGKGIDLKTGGGYNNYIISVRRYDLENQMYKFEFTKYLDIITKYGESVTVIEYNATIEIYVKESFDIIIDTMNYVYKKIARKKTKIKNIKALEYLFGDQYDDIIVYEIIPVIIRFFDYYRRVKESKELTPI